MGVMEYKRCYEDLLVVLIDLYVADIDEEEDKELANLVLGIVSEPIPRINEVKNKGNYLFKKNQFMDAAHLYEQAIKLLCFNGPVRGEDELMFWNLAISLSLNLAACALKLKLFDEARASCSLVLKFEPFNVKALYRRAIAFLNLNLHKKAYDDLKMGLECDPCNKDIIRELEMVENKLLVNSNGKRSSSDEEPYVEDKRSKKMTRVDGLECLESNTVVSGNGNVKQLIDLEPTNQHLKSESSLENLSCNGKSCEGLVEDMDINSDGCIYEYSKRSGSFSRLKIPISVYHKIQKGEEVSYYNSGTHSYMKIRAINPETTYSKDNHKTHEISAIQHFGIEAVNESRINNDDMVEDNDVAVSDVLVSSTSEVQNSEGTDGGYYLDPKPIDGGDCVASLPPMFKFSVPEASGRLQRKPSKFDRATYSSFSTKLSNNGLLAISTASSKTRLRVLRFRSSKDAYTVRQQKNAYSSSRFPMDWKTHVNFPRLSGVSLYHSSLISIGTKRKGLHIPELTYPFFLSAKRLCLGLDKVNSSLATSKDEGTRERKQVLKVESNLSRKLVKELDEDMTTRENLSFIVGQEGSCTMLQIWVDVAWKSDQRAAVGWVVMDNNVEVEVKVTNLKCQNPLQAEVLGIRNVIAWAVEQGFLHIVIYMDCLSFVLQVKEDANMDHNIKSLVKDAIGESGIEHSIGNVIKDFCALAANFHCLAITYVPRSENKRAHRLAKEALNNCTM